MVLYPHNQLAYDRIVDGLKTHQRVCVVQPTGTGKSYITAKIIKENPEKNFLIVTSNKYIVSQFNANFKSLFYNYQIIMYSTLESSRFEYYFKQQYDYIVLDEFHRGGANLWGDKLLQLLNNHKKSKVIGFTATHVRNDINEDGVLRNMAIELFNNNIVHHLSLREAFDTGILPAPYYVTALYDVDPEFKKALKNIENSNSNIKPYLKEKLLVSKLSWEKSKGVSLILKKHITYQRNFIVFCKSIEHLTEMKFEVPNWFRNAFDIPLNIFQTYSGFIDSEENLNNFINNTSKPKNEFNLLLSVDQLNEGLHVPNIHGEILLRPTDSYIIYNQQFGRSLESQGKQPLVFDLVNNFKKNLTLDYFNSNPYYIHTLPATISELYKPFKFKVFDEVKQYADIFEKINQNIDDWNIKFNEFAEALKTAKNYKHLGRSHKNFINVQRKEYLLSNNHDLWRPRKAKLDTLNSILGFDWIKGRITHKSWDARFVEFCKELEKAKKYDNLDERYKQFLYIQKTRYNALSKSKIWKKRKEKLDALIPKLGFNWATENPKKKTWEKQFSAMSKELKTKQNYKKLSSTHKRFLTAQREYFKNSPKSSLVKKRKKKLDQLNEILGFDWLNIRPKTKSWNGQFDAFKNALEQAENYNNIAIEYRDYINKQKLRYRQLTNNTTKEYRKKKLDSLIPLLGFDWLNDNNREVVWEKQFHKFKKALIKAGSYYKLNSKYREYFFYQREQYNRAISSELWLTRKHKWDSLSPLLGFHWLLHAKNIAWNESFINFYQALEEAKTYRFLDKELKTYLRLQRKNYGSAQDMTLWKYRKDKLDSLNEKTGFNWLEANLN